MTSDYLSGQTAIIVAILSWRLLGAIFSIIDEQMAENDRIEKEMKKIVKVIARHSAMLSSLNKLQESNANKDKWADFNVHQLSDAVKKLSNGNISELELQQLYVVFRSAVGNKATQKDFQAWKNFIQDPKHRNRRVLRERS